MQIFSVITVVKGGGGGTYLSETCESVASQRLPKGWSLQWLVQADTETSELLSRLPDKPWISKGVSRTGGTAHTRTVALQRVSGLLTRALDAHALLPDESTLARDVEVLAANPDLGWAVAPTLEVQPDGRFVPVPAGSLPGRLPPGFMADSLRVGNLSATRTTATFYTELLMVHGGWPAIPPLENASPLLAAEAVVDGWMQEKPGEVSRKRLSPQPGGPEHQQKLEPEMTMYIEAVVGRADALRQLGWRWQPSVPAAI
ncbi:GltA [Streptomyces sp. NPDC090088]|uniref:GltA n=1 Tax=Streptomyces sp. NPDC090088 TaxID=3365944 RepID=UPI00381B6CA3